MHYYLKITVQSDANSPHNCACTYSVDCISCGAPEYEQRQLRKTRICRFAIKGAHGLFMKKYS